MKQYFFRVSAVFALSVALASLLPATAQTVTSSGTSMTNPPVTFKIGDHPPPIVAAKWLKGEPVTSFKPGHVYVIEFWATWCAPCIAAMPHLSELARAHKGKATFIGFDVQELMSAQDKNADYTTKVASFVKNIGDGMDYTVAVDVRAGTMYETWLKAAGVYGIPTTFVIDQQGKLSWIGHPGQLDGVLPLVLEGKFDDNARIALKDFYKEKYQQVKILQTALDSLRKGGHTDEALAVANQLIDHFPVGNPTYIMAKYELLKSKGGDQALNYAREVTIKYKNAALVLQSVAEALSKMEGKDEKALAVKIAEQTMLRTAPDDPYAFSSLATVYFNTGDVKKAVAAQEKAVSIVSDSSLVDQHQSVKDKAREDLEKYKSAL